MSNNNNNNSDISGPSDAVDSLLVIPVSRLDADQYSAVDIDGVTESIFGSGNMAYASLQASQTDAAMALDEAVNFQSDGLPQPLIIPPSEGAGISFASDMPSIQQVAGHVIPTDTDRTLGDGDSPGMENVGAEGNFTNTTVAATGAAGMAADKGVSAVFSGFDNGASNHFEENMGGPTNVNNVTNIVNVGDTVENILQTINETINHITNLGDELIENILEGDIGDVVNVVNNEINELTETVNNTVNNVTQTVNNLLEETGVTEITNNVTEIVNNATETITNIINETLDDVLGGGISIDLDSGLLGALGSGLHADIDDSITGNVGTGLVFDNISSLAGSLTGLNIPVLTNAGTNLGFDLLGGADPDDGQDISITGLNLPDIELDALENVIGDIDFEVALPTLSDVGTFAEDLGDLVTSLDDLSLADPAEILDILSDEGHTGALEIVLGDAALGQDLDLTSGTLTDDLQDGLGDLGDPVNLTGLDIPVITDVGGNSGLDVLGGGDPSDGNDITVGDVVVPIELDPLEAVAGDIDINIDDPTNLNLTDDIDFNADDIIQNLQEAQNLDQDFDIGDATDLLGLGNDRAVGDESDLLDDVTWTDSAIDASGMFDDIVNGIGGETDTLPDPVGTVAEGLGALVDPIQNQGGSGGLGGLFG